MIETRSNFRFLTKKTTTKIAAQMTNNFIRNKKIYKEGRERSTLTISLHMISIAYAMLLQPYL